MKKNYQSPEIELISLSTEDIISTSISIELPWLPLQDENEI